MDHSEHSKPSQAYLDAVIEIGATGIRLIVVEVLSSGDWNVIDRAERPLALGRDVFTTGVITRESLLQCLAILNRYREILASWDISDSQVEIVATSAIREARNRDSFLDRVVVKTGFTVRVIDGIEENRLMYLVVDHALRGTSAKLAKINSIVMDVGGGSTEIMLLQKGRVVAAHSFRMGTVIMEQHIKAMMGSLKDLRRFLEEYIKTTAENLNNELKLESVRQLIAIGNDARLVARSIGTQITDLLSEVSRDAFISFVDRIFSFTTEEIMQHFRITYSEAESLVPALLSFRYFIAQTGAEKILVPCLSLREGLIISKLAGPSIKVREEFNNQVIASAQNIAKKYHYDEEHSQYVSRISLKLFDFLQNEHGLDRHARLLLETAAILHDIGSFIRPLDHQLHSFYIVANSDIFGLNKDDISILANIVRYHRGELPNSAHQNYAALPRTERTMVLKLTSLLRIADALDRGHSQHIQDFDIEISKDTILMRSKGSHEISLEKLALEEKADMFEDLFGYKLIML